MSTYESDRDAAAEEYAIKPGRRMRESAEAFKAGADWGYERGANAELKEWRESMRKYHFDEISQKLEAAKVEIERLKTEIDDTCAAASIHADEHRRARNELAEARAENARLREAVKLALDHSCQMGDFEAERIVALAGDGRGDVR